MLGHWMPSLNYSCRLSHTTRKKHTHMPSSSAPDCLSDLMNCLLEYQEYEFSLLPVLPPLLPPSISLPPSLLLILFHPPPSFAFLLSPLSVPLFLSLSLSPSFPSSLSQIPLELITLCSHLPADISHKIETSDNVREITNRRLRSIRNRAYGVSIPH